MELDSLEIKILMAENCVRSSLAHEARAQRRLKSAREDLEAATQQRASDEARLIELRAQYLKHTV